VHFVRRLHRSSLSVFDSFRDRKFAINALEGAIVVAGLTGLDTRQPRAGCKDILSASLANIGTIKFGYVILHLVEEKMIN
jgi:hypothetical protein